MIVVSATDVLYFIATATGVKQTKEAELTPARAATRIANSTTTSGRMLKGDNKVNTSDKSTLICLQYFI